MSLMNELKESELLITNGGGVGAGLACLSSAVVCYGEVILRRLQPQLGLSVGGC